MEDISVIVEHPTVVQRPMANVQNGEQYENIPYSKIFHDRIDIVRPIYRGSLPTPWWLKYRSLIQLCAFILFTIILMTIGIVVVCVTAPNNKNTTCDPIFERKVKPIITYDSNPRYAVIDDINGDTHSDIVIANSGIDNIGIRLGNGNGTFTDQIMYSTGNGSSPQWVAVGDLNNDTLLDIVVANYGTNNIGIFLAYENRSFASQLIFSLNSSRPLSLVVNDINNDNILDIIVASNGTFNITILLGSGNGSFHIEQNYYMGYDSIPCSLAVTDFNNDSWLDIVIVNYGTSDIAILLATENGTFSSMTKYSTGTNSHPSSVTTGDFNHDQYIDIAIANSASKTIGIFIGNGDGTFQSLKTYLTGPNSYLKYIVAGKLNNNGNLDLIVANTGENNIIVFEGYGNGTFSIQTTQSTGVNSYPCAIVVHDIDNDDKSDIVVVNGRTSDILLLTSYALRTTAIQTNYSTGAGSYPNSVAVGDFDEDEVLDIVVANTYANDIGVFIGTGNGNFKSQRTFPAIDYDVEPDSVAVGYFNKDTHLDFAVVMALAGTVDIYLGQGNGNFEYDNSYPDDYDDYNQDNYDDYNQDNYDGSNPDEYDNSYLDGSDFSDLQSIAIADFDDDTNSDIVTASCENNMLIVFYGYGNGKFQNGRTYPIEQSSSCPVFVSIGDFNNDRLSDLISANFDTATISIFLNNRNRTFQDPLTIWTGSYYSSWLAIKDINNDGRQDIVLTSPEFSAIGILLGYGDGSFETMISYWTGYGTAPSSVVLNDFNQDSFVDIIVASDEDSSLGIFFGNGKGYFNIQDPIKLEDVYYPQCIATGDFNNDNLPDIVVGNTGSDDISVLLLRYQTIFGKQEEYSQGSGAHPFSVTTADFNNDNQTDIIVANSGDNTVQVLIGFNNGTFMKNITYSTGNTSHPRYATAADFNRDNLLDIAVVNSYDGDLMILLNSGNDTFNTSSFYSTGFESFPNSIGLGDLNKDGWIDIVVANNNTDNVGVFLGYDYPTFNTYKMVAPKRGSSPYYVVVADFNNDSHYDIAIAFRNMDEIGIYLGNGNGTFGNPMSYSVGVSSGPVSLGIGDFNKDNHLDIAVANSHSNSISIFIGHGDGSFLNFTSYSTGSSSPVSIAIGDLNNDTIQDLVVANEKGNNVGIFIGYGNGSFAKQISYQMSNGSSPVWVVLNDFNKDNILDIVVANRDGNNIVILLGYGNGSFRNVTIYSFGSNSGPSSVAAGDFNKDNIIDIIVVNRYAKNVQIFVGHGDGTFSLQAIYATGASSFITSIRVEDVNNDTILDIIFTDWGAGYGNIGVMYGVKNGTFLFTKSYFLDFNSEPTSIAIYDFNNDGRLDFAVTNSRKNSISIMLRDASEPFAIQTTFSTGSGSRPYSVAVMDVNNDNQLDIAVANFMTNNVGIFLGYGDGNFAEQQIYSTGNNSGPMSIAIGDLDNDKQMDIVVANSKANNTGIFYGDGKGTFGDVQTYLMGYGSEPSSVIIADLYKDNYTDIVVASYGLNTVFVLNGLGNRIFSVPVPYSLEYNARPISVATGNFDNDPWLDIAVANRGPGYVEIFIQACSNRVE